MMGNDCGCGERREYMTLGEYMALYPSAYAEATEQMTERQKRLFELRFSERLLFLPKDETSEQGETLTITANISADTVTPDEDNPVDTMPGGSFFWRYDVSDDAEAPTIAVEGARYVKTAEGSLYVYDVVSNVSISVQAALKTYPVTINVENGTANPASTTIQARGSKTVLVVPNTNYTLYSATGTGATITKNDYVNVITITNPTGAVTVNVVCVKSTYPLDITADNCTYSPKYTQVSAGGTYAITFVANAGYDLPPEGDLVLVDGAQYSWKQSIGVLTIYNPTAEVFVSVTASPKRYSITANITNGTATGANVIYTGLTAALTIAANEGYELPDTITVTGATGTWNKSTGTLSISNPTDNVAVTGECVAAVTYPVKGDLITLDKKQYRVLKANGSVAEVLCMYDANSSVVFDKNSSYDNTYAGKNIDTYCNNTFYSGLSTNMKSAIVDKTFTQDSWTWGTDVPIESHYTGKYGSSIYYLTLANAAYGVSITRHCYCLSVQDVLDYLEATTSMVTSDTTLTDANIWEMFWNASSSQSYYPWLRSAYSPGSVFAFDVSGGSGYLSYVGARNSLAARPAFQIDLSKVEWSKS